MCVVELKSASNVDSIHRNIDGPVRICNGNAIPIQTVNIVVFLYNKRVLNLRVLHFPYRRLNNDTSKDVLMISMLNKIGVFVVYSMRLYSIYNSSFIINRRKNICIRRSVMSINLFRGKMPADSESDFGPMKTQLHWRFPPLVMTAQYGPF